MNLFLFYLSTNKYLVVVENNSTSEEIFEYYRIPALSRVRYYSIGEKKIHLRFKFFWGNGFLSDLVTSQKLNYNYFFLCFYTCMCNEEECINRRSSIYQFLNGAGINEILNNDNFYFVADTRVLNIKNKYKKQFEITNF